MSTNPSLTVTLRGVTGPDGEWVVVPSQAQLDIRKFAVERELEEMDATVDGIHERAMQAVLDARGDDSSHEWDAIIAGISSMSRDARRTELLATLASIGKTQKRYAKYFGSSGMKLEERKFKYHPYTMDERVEARALAEKVDEVTGAIRFDPAVYAVEILRRCLEDADQYYDTDAGGIPTPVGDALFDAIRVRSEPTLDEIFFTVASRQTSGTD